MTIMKSPVYFECVLFTLSNCSNDIISAGIAFNYGVLNAGNKDAVKIVYEKLHF